METQLQEFRKVYVRSTLPPGMEGLPIRLESVGTNWWKRSKKSQVVQLASGAIKYGLYLMAMPGRSRSRQEESRDRKSGVRGMGLVVSGWCHSDSRQEASDPNERAPPIVGETPSLQRTPVFRLNSPQQHHPLCIAEPARFNTVEINPGGKLLAYGGFEPLDVRAG